MGLVGWDSKAGMARDGKGKKASKQWKAYTPVKCNNNDFIFPVT